MNWRGFQAASWVGLVILAVLLGYGLIQGKVHGGGALLTSALAAGSAIVVFHSRLPSLFSFLLVLASLMSGAGWLWELYRRVVPFDEVAHGLAVLALTLVTGFYLYSPLLSVFRNHRLLLGLTLGFLGISLGAFWEIIEYFLIYPRPHMTLHDTVTDLLVDTLGACLAVLLALRAVPRPGSAARV